MNRLYKTILSTILMGPVITVPIQADTVNEYEWMEKAFEKNLEKSGYNISSVNQDTKAFADRLNSIPIAFSRKTEQIQNHHLMNKVIFSVDEETLIYLVPKSVARNSTTVSTQAQIVSSAATVYSSFTYDYYYQGSAKMMKLTSASGSVGNLNSGFRFSRADVIVGNVGPGGENQRITTTKYTSSWTIAAPSSWTYVMSGTGTTSIGTTITAYRTRDGSTLYSGTVPNTIS